jgi:hypothetical protein
LIPVKLGDEVPDDLRALPSDRLRRVALESMAALRSDPHRGARLDWRLGNDLSRARKLYFDEGDTPLRTNFLAPPSRPDGPRYRIVYELLPTQEQPTLVRVIAVGPKIDPGGGDGVYRRASERT